ncbi:MAG: chaperone modulator CbpM [Bacteroidetes bacterium]|nr:chaperone modulator CbpM [Bacteroidota bacterium]
MAKSTLITATDFCTLHHVDYAFVDSLSEAGLVELTVINETRYVSDEQLPRLEKMARLHTELDINLAGIEAISHLLQRMETIHEEMRLLRNRLRRYEGSYD